MNDKNMNNKPLNETTPKKDEGFAKKLGDTLERAGEKIGGGVGEKVEKLGDKIEHSHEDKGVRKSA